MYSILEDYVPLLRNYKLRYNTPPGIFDWQSS